MDGPGHLAVIGVNHRTAPIQVRERFHLGAAGVREALREAGSLDPVAGCVILSTCNRVELYVSSSAVERAVRELEALLSDRSGFPPEEAREYMYGHRGREAVRHLFRVVAGLESLVPGEAEIQGQVGDAYEVARRVEGGGTADSLLHRLFQEALAAGGEVRARTAVGEGAASVPSAAVRLARKVYGELEGCRAVVVGAGAMGRLTMECLVEDGVRPTAVASRTLERARGVAEAVGGEPVELESVGEILADVDILVTCTSAGDPVLRASDLAERGNRRGHPLVILDIAVPRDVDPDVERFPEIFLYNIDDLQRVVEGAESERLSEVPRAEEILEEGVDAYCRWVRSRQAVPMIRELRGRAREVREGTLEELFAELERGEEAPGLDEEGRSAIRDAVRKMMNRLLHEPTVALRETAGRPDGGRYLEAMRRLFDLDAGAGGEQGTNGRGASSTDAGEEIDDG